MATAATGNHLLCVCVCVCVNVSAGVMLCMTVIWAGTEFGKLWFQNFLIIQAKSYLLETVMPIF